MDFSRKQLLVVKHAVEDKLESKKESYKYWTTTEYCTLSDEDLDFIIKMLEKDIKELNSILEVLSNAICEE